MSTHNMFSLRNKKNINPFGLKKKASYQELCYGLNVICVWLKVQMLEMDFT